MSSYRSKAAFAIIIGFLITQVAVSQPPDTWEVNPNMFQYSMTFTTLLKMQGNVSEDPDDAIAAFIGDECRGVARPSDSISSQYSNVAFLIVYSNTISGDTISFKLYDADEDTIIALPHRALFSPNADPGLPSKPLVNIAERDLIALNFFTPNNDGYNDTWKIRHQDIYIDYEVFIYDSNGQEVFHEEKLYRSNWDGRHNGKKLPEGVYYYLLKDAAGKVAYKGTISLVR